MYRVLVPRLLAGSWHVKTFWPWSTQEEMDLVVIVNAVDREKTRVRTFINGIGIENLDDGGVDVDASFLNVCEAV